MFQQLAKIQFIYKHTSKWSLGKHPNKKIKQSFVANV